MEKWVPHHHHAARIVFSQEQRLCGVSLYLIYLPLCHKLKFPALISLPSTRLYVPPQLTFSIWIFTGISKTDLLMLCILLHASHPAPYFLFSYCHAKKSCLLWGSSYNTQPQCIVPVSPAESSTLHRWSLEILWPACWIRLGDGGGVSAPMEFALGLRWETPETKQVTKI